MAALRAILEEERSLRLRRTERGGGKALCGTLRGDRFEVTRNVSAPRMAVAGELKEERGGTRVELRIRPRIWLALLFLSGTWAVVLRASAEGGFPLLPLFWIPFSAVAVAFQVHEAREIVRRLVAQLACSSIRS